MKGSGERSRSRTPGALWIGAPLVLAACVAAEAGPESCGRLERMPAQTRLTGRVRDGVAHLACSTRHAIGRAHVAFVLLTLERLAGGAAFCTPWHAETVRSLSPLPLDLNASHLDPGRTSSPIAAP